MIGLVPVRSGVPAAGAVDVLAEAGGRAILVGSRTEEADQLLATSADGSLGERLSALTPDDGSSIRRVELGGYEPARWAAELAPLLGGEQAVVLPSSPDGRDLAPHLARRLGRQLLAGALRVHPGGATLSRAGGLQSVEVACDAPFVATLLPGQRRAPTAGRQGHQNGAGRPAASRDGGEQVPPPETERDDAAVRSLEVLEPDPAAMDLAEAGRIVAGGAGVGGEEEFALLQKVAAALGASVGATRVVTDAGLLPHDRQVGTTGVSVRPRLYLAFGISGAAHHVGGIGEPDHVIAVNLDPSCPMMTMADLAVVSDAPATLRALAGRLGVTP